MVTSDAHPGLEQRVAAVPPREWQTARLAAAAATRADADAVLESYARDPEVARYMVWRPHRDVGETLAFLETCEAAWASGKSYSWCLRLKPDGPLVGMLSARVRGESMDMGYVLGRRWWRRGLMSEAVTWLVQWAWEQPTIARVWATCDVDNAASAGLLERIGMRREGTLRRWVPRPSLGGGPRDSLTYSLLRNGHRPK
ncbi:MAG TPA: GNAT family N-acetyltransferase [Gammaproteobacteria bacterium]|nr:GNAT family N-acetyltransferase [Gammaproteobacteria bacterium]